MAEIIKTYRQELPALRFIGKKYGEADRVNGTFGKHWGDWFQNNWFDVIKKYPTAAFDDGDAFIGLERHKQGEPFEYWIGMFMPQETPVPEGYSFQDFPQASLGVCWVYGKEGEVFMQEENCMKKLAKDGYKLLPDGDGFQWAFERYGCPRYTKSDKDGKIILDLCFFVA